MVLWTDFHSPMMAQQIYRGKRVLVLGGGKSGEAAAKLLIKAGAEVALVDERPTETMLEKMQELSDLGVSCYISKLSELLLNFAQEIILSPGIALNHPFVQAAILDGVMVRSEIELASRFACAPIIAITATDGKSTTTAMITHLLQQAGYNALIGGNYGIPFSEVVMSHQATEPRTIYVIEVSSYQLEHCRYFHPQIALVLNIATDHLSRHHHSMKEYQKAKSLITKFQGQDDHLIINADDQRCQDIAAKTRAKVWEFSMNQQVQRGAFYCDNTFYLANQSIEEIFCYKDFPLPGRHNIENALAAIIASYVVGAPNDALQKGLSSFQGLEHRIEFVSEIDGVRYFNDSKATTLNALEKALNTFNEPIVLIAGGRKKEDNYESIRNLLSRKVKAIILIGESSAELMKNWHNCAPSIKSSSMKEAINISRGMAAPGDVVLLSPACASFDMYSGFEERGRDFKINVMFMKADLERQKLSSTSMAVCK